MTISVTIAGHLLHLLPHLVRESQVEIKAGSTLEVLIANLGIPPALVATIAVNGEAQHHNYAPRDGDQIVILSPISGG